MSLQRTRGRSWYVSGGWRNVSDDPDDDNPRPPCVRGWRLRYVVLETSARTHGPSFYREGGFSPVALATCSPWTQVAVACPNFAPRGGFEEHNKRAGNTGGYNQSNTSGGVHCLRCHGTKISSASIQRPSAGRADPGQNSVA